MVAIGIMTKSKSRKVPPRRNNQSTKIVVKPILNKNLPLKGLRKENKTQNNKSELKIGDTITTINPIPITGSIITQTSITKGTNREQRIGNKIFLEYYFNNYIINAGSAVQNTPPFFPNVIRIIHFVDKENRQAVPAVLDVLEVDRIDSPMNHINFNRFLVLSDKRYLINDNAPRIAPTDFKRLKFTANYNDGNTGSVADYQENHPMILVISQNIAGASAPSMTIWNRLRWRDP